MINKDILDQLKSRTFFSYFNENPKFYDPEQVLLGEKYFDSVKDSKFNEIVYQSSYYCGNEFSPFLNSYINIQYPAKTIENYIIDANFSGLSWVKRPVNERITILQKSLEAVSRRFFDIAFATMHTTGQSFLMSFQASGPHAADRSLETLAVAQQELTRYNTNSEWNKDFGKFTLSLDKDFIPIGKGIGLVIGCSTFPTWNSVTGIYANLACGNPVIVKPHPKAILPIAIYVAEIRKTFKASGVDENLIQLAVDTIEEPIAKEFIEHDEIKLIDYTGGNVFGDYVESRLDKTVFTEKAGVNCCIIDSVEDIDSIYSNLAFSLTLYSGQMCTAPQNIFVPERGVDTPHGIVSFEDFCNGLSIAITNLVNNPRAGAGTAGAIQNPNTLKRINEFSGGKVILQSKSIENTEFPMAVTASPMLVALSSDDKQIFSNECFGPIAFVIKTKDTEESLSLASELARKKGAITCLAYSTNGEVIESIKIIMNSVFVPVSFNFTGAAFVNQHAAFSDFHVTGGNPAGNATFTNADYINRRFIWVGNRYMK